jgi:hypothetical protein
LNSLVYEVIGVDWWQHFIYMHIQLVIVYPDIGRVRHNLCNMHIFH